MQLLNCFKYAKEYILHPKNDVLTGHFLKDPVSLVDTCPTTANRSSQKNHC